VEVTSVATTTGEVLEVLLEVLEVRNNNTSKITSLLPKDARSQALTKISTVPPEVGSTSSEVKNSERCGTFRLNYGKS